MFNGQRALVAAFFVIMAVQTWRFIKNPPADMPLENWPPPYIYTGTVVVFALLAVLGSITDPRLAGALGIGLAFGVVWAETQKTKKKKTSGPPPRIL